MSRGTPDWGAVAGGVQSVAEALAYIAPNQITIQPVATKTILSCFNPAGSGVIGRAYVAAAYVSTFGNSGPHVAQLVLRRTTSLGTGTIFTPAPHDPNDAAGAIVFRENHTVEPGFGGILGGLPIMLAAKDTGAYGYVSEQQDLFELFRHQPGSQLKPILIRPGGGLAITVIYVAGSAAYAGILDITEEPA
jgi:hypothetical protein